jgi:hypothetical protein
LKNNTPISITRLGAALIWLAVILVLLELPSDIPFIDSLSKFFGGTETTDAVGHAVIFCITAFVFRWALSQVASARTAALWSIGISGMLGVLTELMQFNTRFRGVTMLDIGANWLGVVIAGVWFAYRFRTNRGA